MKQLILFVLPLFWAASLNAQTNMGSNYTTAMGVKLYPGAVSVKHFLSKGKAVEGLGYISSDGFRVTGLYELHYPLGQVDGLQWFVGGGAHLGIWSDAWKAKYPGRNNGLALGVDGILGIDYKITGAPLNISFDWQPSFNLIGYNYFEGGWGGLAIRYTF
ncbi:MAG: hypothetical protein FD183_664 [Chitinophagaceae bacterium]|nr:MAG: hypothetical protein FD183_664 [Chitinophagaceae bacterium]